jgi:hypothetical protein
MKGGADFVKKKSISILRKNWYLQNLLCAEELIENGGKGVSILNNCSMNNILMRWSFLMIHITLHKLRPIIEILED